MKNLIYISCLLLTTPGICQLTAEKTAISKIKTEGFQHSQAYALLTELTDEIGPRLTGSRQYLKAASWAKSKLEGWKLQNVHFESYCPDCMGWEVRSFDVEMTSPSYLKVNAYPCAWTVGSNGIQEGTIVYIPETELSDLQQYSGKLSGKVVLFGRSPEQDMYFEPLTSRYTSDQLTTTAKSIEPNPHDPLGLSLHGMPFEQFLQMFKERKDKYNEVYEFFRKEGALAIMKTSRPTFPGIVHADGTYNVKKDDPKSIPIFTIAPEHFSRMVRLLDRGSDVNIRFHLDTDLYLEPKNNVNIFAEIPGSDPKLKDQVVLIGGHFDSWHGGEGAGDNGSGSVVMMEVMRILQAQGIHPKRTVRLALWGGEEQGLLGSLGYANDHLKPSGKKEPQSIAVYLNLDFGPGAVRGIFAQGNEAAKYLFSDMLSEFEYLDAATVSIENIDFTDHDVFNAFGVPGFQFIQDPLNYYTVTHHTTLDVPDYAPVDDLKKSAVVIASLVYKIAQMEQDFPSGD